MNSVKITSGELRGRKIETPGEGTHPMGAREKLALFNMIADALPGARVLDLYAGSGALGIEAISRGAKEVVFVEKNPSAARIIKSNLANLGVLGQVWAKDVRDFSARNVFDIVIADPPYDNFNPEEMSGLSELLADRGVLVLSHPGEAPDLDGLRLLKTRGYAGARISVYQKF